MPALAHGPGRAYGYHSHGYYHGNHWVTPLVIGGILGYAVTRHYDPVIVQQPPVIVQQPTVANTQVCTPWIETQQADGTVVRQRTCNQ